MADAPCGCDLVRRAAATADARAAAVFRADGERFQALWRCPGVRAGRGGCSGAPAAACADARRRVARLLEVDDADAARSFPTCPLWVARQPWAHAVMRARRWAARGELVARVGYPSAALADALDAIDEAAASREADDLRRARACAQDGGGHAR